MGVNVFHPPGAGKDSMGSVGRSIPRIGAEQSARGHTRFGDDIPLERPLILKVVRSDRIHAEIVEIDVRPALNVPGVAGILTHRDIPGKNAFGLINKDQPLLAFDKVRFQGEAVALIAAEDEEAAGKAADAVRVEYQDLPTVRDPIAALSETAPPIHPTGNLLFKRLIRKGCVEEALSKSDVTVKGVYLTPHLEHNYLEPDAGAGYVDGDGTLVVYASTQNPHYDRQEIASILGLDTAGVRVIQAATGGGFGSKLDLTAQGYVGLALYHFRRPVRLVYGREETYLATAKRHPLRIEMTSGADRGGRLKAVKARIICDTGAYASYGLAVAIRAAVHATGPYEVENVEVESLCVYTNNPFAGAMRGFGVPQAAFAHESQMDLLAERLAMDPLEIRKVNALRPGSVTATGQRLERSVGMLATLEAVEPHYLKARDEWAKGSGPEHRKRGVGLGCMFYGIGNTGVRNPSTAVVEMDREGRVTLYAGVADIGQGSTTVLTQIASEVLKLASDRIHPVIADTGLTENAGATSASRQTYISGNAVKEAAQKLSDALIAGAADILKLPGDRLILKDAHVVERENESRRLSFRDLAGNILDQGIPLRFEGDFDPPTTALDPDTGQGRPYATYAFATHLALLEVDTRTGKVSVSRIFAAHDVGKAIHPRNVEGQIQGGVAMGLGFALMEEFRPGITSSMSDYRIPTSADMPDILPIIVEDPEPTGPFGAKGVGEPALIPTAPAVINALAFATGNRICDLPAVPERVWKSLKARR